MSDFFSFFKEIILIEAMLKHQQVHEQSLTPRLYVFS